MKEQNKNEQEDKKIKSSSSKLKKVLKTVAITATVIAIAATAFGVAGSITNNKMNKENLVAINQITQTLNYNSESIVKSTIETFKKDTYNRNYLSNSQYFDTSNFNISPDFFHFPYKDEFRGSNVFYHLTEYKNLSIYVDPSIPYERKVIVREVITYLNNIFHTIDPNITIQETSTLLHAPTCIHVKDNMSLNDPSDSRIGDTFIAFEGDDNFNDTVNVEIYVNQLDSYGHNEEYFNAAYKTVVMHELTHALGFPHIPDHRDDSGRFGRAVSFNELNRPLMSRTINSMPNDRYSAYEIAGFFGLINYYKYINLASKADKSEYQQRLNDDYKKYLSLVEYSINQSKGYKLGMKSEIDGLDANQIVQLSYEEKVDKDGTYQKAEVLLTLNSPYIGYYEKILLYEDGSQESYYAPYFKTKDSDGKYKYSLMGQDLKSFENCNLYVSGKESTLVASNLTYNEVKNKIKDLDPNCGYYVVEDGNYGKEYVYTTQNFWQQFLNQHQDNIIYYDEPLFSLYQTSPRWTMQNKDGNSISASEVTNELIHENESTDENNFN